MKLVSLEKVIISFFSNSISSVTSPFDLVHTDLWGPALVLSIDGFPYYVLFVDDYSPCTWLFPLKQKSDTMVAFKNFRSLFKTSLIFPLRQFKWMVVVNLSQLFRFVDLCV